MTDREERENFLIGTVNLIAGLAFVTVIPIIMSTFFVYMSPVAYRLLGGFFLIWTIIFYFLSPNFHKKQLLATGISFITFSLFQFFFTLDKSSMPVISGFISLIIGIILTFTGTYDKRSTNK